MRVLKTSKELKGFSEDIRQIRGKKKQLMSNTISNKFTILKPVTVLGKGILCLALCFKIWNEANK